MCMQNYVCGFWWLIMVATMIKTNVLYVSVLKCQYRLNTQSVTILVTALYTLCTLHQLIYNVTLSSVSQIIK